MPTSQPVLSALDVSRVFRLGKVEVPALNSVTLSIAPSEFLAIAGPSGSGKTTLLNLLGCLDRPNRGEIWVNGRNTRDLSSRELAHVRAKDIGFVFQTFNLIPTLNAIENVEYPLLVLGVRAAERRSRAMDALERVGLAQHGKHRPAELSGGQRQRVAIARAVVKNPAIILADEPTANLDQATADSVLEIMQTLNHEAKVTFVFSSHDPNILRRASRVFPMKDGAVDTIYTWAGNKRAL